MLRLYARGYFIAAYMLEHAYGHLYAWELMHPDQKVVSDSDGAGHKQAIIALQYAAQICREIPLGNLDKEIDRAILEYKDAAISDRLKVELNRLGHRFRDELSDKRFLYVPPDFAKFYNKDDLFGIDVFDKFKDARGDIKNAGNCYAVGEPTACVFHLMRAMEVVVRKLGKRMNVNIPPGTTWRKITGDMDAKIKALPDDTARRREKKELWEEARANLHHVGSVWRNKTMHPAKSYSPSQAKDVLDACRVFMTGLCDL